MGFARMCVPTEIPRVSIASDGLFEAASRCSGFSLVGLVRSHWRVWQNAQFGLLTFQSLEGLYQYAKGEQHVPTPL